MKVDPRLLVAEGDSWFSHPKDPADILDLLDDEVFDYKILHKAHHGDKLEEMANHPNQQEGVRRLMRTLAKKQRIPIAILLSGGGNDIIEVIDDLILDERLGDGILDRPAVDEFINGALFRHYVTTIDYMTDYSQECFSSKVRILVHGYGYIVPDGRGKRDANGEDVGWVKKALSAKRHLDLKENTAAIEELIDVFNAMVETVANRPGHEHVRYVNLRDCASNDLRNHRYRKDWRDELHLRGEGLKRAARSFDEAIRPRQTEASDEGEG